MDTPRHEAAHTQDELDGIVFLGQTLGPLFEQDPKTGQASALYDGIAALDAAAAAAEWPFCEQQTQAVEQALSLMQQGIAGGMDAVTREYRRLFVGPARKAAPPWGSVYTDHDGVMFGESALALHDWLSAHDVCVAADDHLPDDHIGRMLCLMAWLAETRPEMLDDYLELHLLTWAPHFLEYLAAQTRHALFSGLATLTATSLAGVQESFGLHPVTPRFYR